MTTSSDPTIATAFGDLVRRLRQARGWSQSALASEAGLSSGYVSLIETGQRGAKASPRTLVALADALECDPVDLFAAAGRSMSLSDIQRLQANLDRTAEVIRAIQRDSLLRPVERESLIRLYGSYTNDRRG